MGQTSDNTPSLDSSAQQSVELEPVPPRRPLSTPWVRGQLIVELAAGEISQVNLAKKYGVHRSAITQFKKTYQQEIDRRRDSLEDEFSDLWIADKRARLATLQDTAEGLVDMDLTPRTAEVLAKLLKDAAEELDQLGNKNQVNIQMAEYRITGIDLDRL